jgi:hypothetical protein
MLPGEHPCKACGCPIALVPGPNGTNIPLDLRSPVYRIERNLLGEVTCVRAVETYVSHFCSCPKAEQFSRSRRA